MRGNLSQKRLQRALIRGTRDALLLIDVNRSSHPSTTHIISRNSHSKTNPEFHLVYNDKVTIASRHPFARLAANRSNCRTLCTKFTKQRGGKGRMKCICGKGCKSKKPHMTHLQRPACPIILMHLTEDTDRQAFREWLPTRATVVPHPPNKAELGAELCRFVTSSPSAALPHGG